MTIVTSEFIYLLNWLMIYYIFHERSVINMNSFMWCIGNNVVCCLCIDQTLISIDVFIQAKINIHIQFIEWVFFDPDALLLQTVYNFKSCWIVAKPVQVWVWWQLLMAPIRFAYLYELSSDTCDNLYEYIQVHKPNHQKCIIKRTMIRSATHTPHR